MSLARRIRRTGTGFESKAQAHPEDMKIAATMNRTDRRKWSTAVPVENRRRFKAGMKKARSM